jgi:hypothetical protein
VQLIEYFLHCPFPPGAVFQQWGNILLGAFLGVALSLLVLGGLMRLFSARHAVHARLTRQVVTYGLILQAVGILVLWLRWLDFPVISMRLWLFLALIAQVAALARLGWWLRNRYPDLLAEFEWEERKRAYLPRAAGGSAPPIRRRAAARRK